MSIIWHKVWRDLAHNKTRTLLVVLSTAVGVFALGLVFGLSGVMRARLTEDHRATIPAHISFWGGRFDQEVVEAVRREPGIADVEAEVRAVFRWKREGEADWRDGNLVARTDYTDQRMNRIDLLEGSWPAERTLVVERQSARYFAIGPGTSILAEFGRRERRLPVQGIVRVPTVFPPQFGGDATFYTTPDTVAWLTGLQTPNRLNVRLVTYSRERAEAAAQAIQDRLERMGVSIGGYTITDPNVHWIQDQVDTLFLILGVLGMLSLGLSAFLIINTMNAIIAQQVWQIGVMKVIGATFARVVRIYLMVTLLYGALALLVAVPLGTVGAHLMAGWMLDLVNVTNGPFRPQVTTILLQAAVGLTVPVLAGLVPVIGGARITPHQAIRTYGLGADFGRSWLDHLIGRIRRLPRPLALSLRNTFRHKARVSLTLLTLVLGGVIFIVVMSVGSSLNNTLDMLLNDLGFDVLLGFDRPYRVGRLVEIAETVPGVAKAEVWNYREISLALGGGEEREAYLWGVPPDSALFSPRIVSGRGFLPGDGRALLLNSKIAAEEGIQVGDTVRLTLEGRESDWTVVGLVLSINNDQRDNFAPFDAMTRAMGSAGRGSIVMVATTKHDLASQTRVGLDLRAAYKARRMEPTFVQSAGEVRASGRAQFNILTYLMLAMALLAALVGSMGLMGTMSINVVERSREIGVMRAIGATSVAIVTLFVSEGMVLGALSWLLALPLSYPGARLFSNVVGSTLMRFPLDFRYSVVGVLLWLTIVLVLSALASLWPALRAARISVREALAYE